MLEPPYRVLVAEDVTSLALAAAEFLKRRGYEVETAADGEECLAKVRSFRPRLIVMDIMMPKVHGLEAMHRLRQDPSTRDIGVIVCTTKSYRPDHDSARDLGAFDVVVKPFQLGYLAGRVDAFFAGLAPSATVSKPAAPAGAVSPYLPGVQSKVSWRLWGTRGSIPVSGPGYVRHGGNTSCMSFDGGGPLVVLDAGSGIRELGQTLIAGGPREIHLFITHTHWDHIQGFPFFAPAYIPGFRITIYAAAGFGKDINSVFLGQLDRDYFPAQPEDMRAGIEFVTLRENPVTVGACKVAWEYTHHPNACVGYRVEACGKQVVVISDNEFLRGFLGAPEAALADAGGLTTPYAKIVEFAKRADVLIHEAQYTNEEYQTKAGWGHSSVSNACALVKLAGARRWIVTHHDPGHTDDFLETKLAVTRQILSRLGHEVELSHAYDGMTGYL